MVRSFPLNFRQANMALHVTLAAAPKAQAGAIVAAKSGQKICRGTRGGNRRECNGSNDLP